MNKLTKSGYFFIRIITGILAGIFIIYSFFTLWDMYRTEINAFASYDLLKYRPDIEHNKPPYLTELLKINPDTAGWVTIYGTNIDYPIMRGKSDNEYLNKSATGDYTVSGSIFMSTLNKKDFSDPYILIYGHHMANGSMFGDIDKFKKDKDFFYNKNNKRFKYDEGVLIKQNEVWNLKVFAVVKTDAYDNMIYRSDKKQEEISDTLKYIKEHSKYYRDVGKINKILAMSTCNSATTDGRTILMCKMTVRTKPLPTREAEPLTPHRKALGHPMAGAYWSFLNLVCVLIIILFVFKSFILKEKRNFIKQKNKKVILSLVLELCLMFFSVIFFILTEDMHKPFQMVDIWTLPMLLIVLMVFGIEKYTEKKLINNHNNV